MRATTTLLVSVLAACSVTASSSPEAPTPTGQPFSSGMPSPTERASPSPVLPVADDLVWDLVEDEDLFPGSIGAMASNGDVLVAGGITCADLGQCTPSLWRSDDGLSWERSPKLPGTSGSAVTAVGFGSSGWVAFADQFAWYSPDGHVWTSADSQGSFDGRADGGPSYQAETGCCGTTVRGVAAAADWYVAVGAVTCHRCLGRAAIWRSSDGRQWERLPYDDAFEGAPLFRIAALPGGRLVAVGYGSALVSDDLGLTWVASPAFGEAYAMLLTMVGDDLLAAGLPFKGIYGVYWRSSDGMAWEPVDIGLQFPEPIPTAIGSTGDMVLVAGTTHDHGTGVESEFIVISPDLATWRLIRVEDDAPFRIWSLADVDGVTVAAGNIAMEGEHPAAVWLLK